MPQVEGRRRHRWRPGTQAMKEVRNYMRTMNLLIPRAPFLWYVCMSNVSKYYTVHSTVQYMCIKYCRSCQTYVYLFDLICFRMVREITFREFQRVKDRRHISAPDITDKELARGNWNMCPL